MKKISDLKEVFDLSANDMMKEPINGLLELDDMMLSIYSDDVSVISATFGVESLVLGLISRRMAIPCHEPSEEIPYWWIQLEMRCGGVLTLKSVDVKSLANTLHLDS